MQLNYVKPSVTAMTLAMLLLLRPIQASAAAAAQRDGLADQIIFGNAFSDQSHDLVVHHGKFITGGLGESAIRLLPLNPPTDNGGYLTLTMRTNPVKRNYITCQFWGSDFGTERGRLILSCNGKQVGYQVQGDYNTLNGAENAPPAPPFADRFYFVTTPLPLRMTHGHTTVRLKIQAIGREWPYGGYWKQYQYVQKLPSLAMYRLFIHTNAFIVPPLGDRQAVPLPPAPVRTKPGLQALSRLKNAVNGYLRGIMRNRHLPDGMNHLDVLAKAYNTPWSVAYHQSAVLKRLMRDIDLHAIAATAQARGRGGRWQAFSNAGWSTFGPAGDAICRIYRDIGPYMHQQVRVNGKMVPRVKLWGAALRIGRDYLAEHQRAYSNQCMIVNFNLYACNKALEHIDPALAWRESKALHYLKVAVGLAPYLGSRTAHGWQRPYGNHYTVVTRAGLTRELGYVATYGEIQIWPYRMWRLSGSRAIKKQYEKIFLARSFFRYPARDRDGYRCMRLEEVIGWRHDLYPSIIAYGDPSTGRMMQAAAALGMSCPQAVGYAQQCLADNQFFRAEQQAPSQFFRGTTVLTALSVPQQYAKVAGMPPVSYRLPMSHGQPDFVWSDPQNGVVVIKHGHDRLWASLYYRAQLGINSLARIQLTQPTMDRLVTVHEHVLFPPSGMYNIRQNWTDVNFRYGYTRQDHAQQAFAGQKLPIPVLPHGYKIHSGRNGETSQEGPYLGRASFYRLHYGHYLIAMNTSRRGLYHLTLLLGITHARNLVTGKLVSATRPLTVRPRQTIVLYVR
jgi:hypothetical protein